MFNDLLIINYIMLDQFSIFTRGGVLLWTKSFAPVKGDPLNSLIKTCLLEDRTGETSYTYKSSLGGSYIVKWLLNNKLGVVYVAIHQKSLKVHYVERLLQTVDRTFSKDYSEAIEKGEVNFEEQFTALHRAAESENNEGSIKGTTVSCRPLVEAKLQAVAATRDGLNGIETIQGVQSSGLNSSEAAQNHVDPVEGKETETAFNAAVLSKKFAKKGKKPDTSAQNKKIAPQKGKKARRWNDLGVDTGEPEEALDYTDGVPPEESCDGHVLRENFQKTSLMDVNDEAETSGHQSDDEAQKDSSGLLGSFVRNLGVSVVGTQALTRDHIDGSLQELKKKLMERNVAEEIANKVIESVAASLIGKKLASFTRVSSAVKAAVEDALVRILTPKKSIDILRGVKDSRARGRPYVIVFVGVNGVGKSTNLSKVAYWLLQNHFKVMIAACDTFRSGAVEQLKTHCTRLGVSLYERGYEKDPAKVAFEATKAAQKEGCDVVLVDTAGRMQDNEPLMRALSNLISFNSPDLVLFVGEALVGNDAVDQLTKFNKRLADLASGPDAHLIDGIVLTKFDTIDEKVGAALSMVYTSGAPIVFVGCGQTYVDLKRLNVKSVVSSLLK